MKLYCDKCKKQLTYWGNALHGEPTWSFDLCGIPVCDGCGEQLDYIFE